MSAVKPVPPELSKGEEARLAYWGASGSQPDTLPWQVDPKEPRMIVDCVGHDIAMTYGAKDRRPVNAKYIAHASSAYPKLVEALKGMVEHHDSGRTEPYSTALRLLRSLGEAK